jgi:hypothetical protein
VVIVYTFVSCQLLECLNTLNVPGRKFQGFSKSKSRSYNGMGGFFAEYESGNFNKTIKRQLQVVIPVLFSGTKTLL